MFERLTDRARRVLVLAQQEAQLLGHGAIGTEHILLGLIQEQHGVAAQVLGELGITLDAVRVRVEQTIAVPAGEPAGSPPFTPRAKKILDLSLRNAMQIGHSYIGTEHLLLGIVGEGEGVAAQTLQDLGVELPRVRREVIRKLSSDHGGASLGGRAISPERSDSPRCHRCSAEIEPLLRYRSITISPTPPSSQPLPVDIVFCDNCGYTVTVLRSDSDR